VQRGQVITVGDKRHPLTSYLVLTQLLSDTWGPPGDPYAGGPGEGQDGSGGSGSGGASPLVYQGASSVQLPYCSALLWTLCLFVLATL
jgi:hypothetical protein